MRNAVLAALLAAAGLMVGSAGPSATAQAQDYRYMGCDELWYARNQIYAEKGYCFRTQRARAVFGPRCYPPYGRLSRYEQEQIERIKRWEGRKGCPR